MYFSFDKFNRYEIPEMVLCNPNFEELYVINPDTAPKFTLRYNAISELSFEIDSVDDNGDEVPYFGLITKNRVIHVEGFGYWVIDSAADSSEGFASRKEVHCYSYEYMLTMRNADIKAGTYNFYDIATPDDTLMDTILGRCPSWKIGNTISSELIGKYRTFDMPDTTVYTFLTQDAAEAYEAVFVFDNENLTINAYTASEAVTSTDIVFTWDNLMKSVEIAETDDPVITALDIYGAGNLSIASINPLGTPTIYRFDYFAEQMSSELWKSVKAWQDEIDEQIQTDNDDDDGTSYRGLLARKLELSNKVIEVNSEIADGLAMLDSGKQVQDVSTPYTMKDSSVKAVNGDIETNDTGIKGWIDTLTYDQKKTMVLNATSYPVIDLGFGVGETTVTPGVEKYVQNIATDDGGIAEALVNIYLCEQFIAAATQNKNDFMEEIAGLDTAISKKNENLSMAKCFTKEQLLELDKFIFGSTYTNEYFVLSENYTFADMQEVARQLYEQGKNALTRISQPNYNFSLEAMNFLFMKEYEHFALQCKLGCTVNAEIREDEWVSPILLEMEIDFGDPDNFSMTWGNRYRLQTAEWTWAELNNEVSKTSGVVSANFSDMIKPVRSGELDRFAEFMNSALDTSRNAVLAGNNQSMLIDSHGILGRKEKEDTVNEYEPEQIKVLNNGIYLTDDNWLNCAMAIGKVTVGGIDKFGVIADVLVGSMLIGNNLSIINENNSFRIDGAGLLFGSTEDNGRIRMNPSSGFYMETKKGDTWIPQISMDLETGKVTISGELISIPDVEVDTVGGWDNKDAAGLQKVGTSDFARLGGNSYAFSAGTISSSSETAKFSVDYDGTLNATDATITGKITATAGAIGGWNISDKNLVSNGGSISAGDNFSVTSDGVLTAEGGSFGGTLNSVSGSFTNLTATGSINFRSGTMEIGYFQGDAWIDFGGTAAISGGSGRIDMVANSGVSIAECGLTVGDRIECDDLYVGNYDSTESNYIPNCRIDTDNGHIYRTSHSNSSIRYKTDVRVADGWENIYNLEGVKHKYKDDASGRVMYGLIAEQVNNYMPELVEYVHDNNGNRYPDNVDYSRLVVPILCALQDLNRRVKEIENGAL